MQVLTKPEAIDSLALDESLTTFEERSAALAGTPLPVVLSAGSVIVAHGQLAI